MIGLVTILFLLGSSGGVPTDSVYARALEIIASDPAPAEFLGLKEPRNLLRVLRVADSMYTIDRFPFTQGIEGGSVSIFLAEMLRPLRAAFAASLARFPQPEEPQGVIFFSPPERDTLVAELFPFRQNLNSYEEYCMSTDSMKFLLSMQPNGAVWLLRTVHLLR